MVVIKITGGLGNQMFQYAAAKALSLDKKLNLKIDKSSFQEYKLHAYGLHHFNVKPKFYSADSIWKKKFKRFFKKTFFYKESTFDYNKELFNINADEIFLEGYFQSEKYFINYENEIRNDFLIKSPLKQQTIDTVTYMQSVNAVSIHFRRVDYIGNAVHETDKTEFYKEALKLIESKVKNPVYFLFSDDMPWVKENFTTNFETHYIDFNNAETNYEDLKLMSSCKHNIVTNSSFSWWGAWLNSNPGKIVVAPKLWFNDEKLDAKDIIPESWIKV